MDIQGEIIRNEDVNKLYAQSYKSVAENPYILLTPYQRVKRQAYLKHHERVQDFNIFEDDIWIATFPKSGTRWMQELVWCLKHGLGNEKGKDLEKRVPFFELEIIFGNVPGIMTFDEVESMETPRIIKTHLSFDMLPKQIMEKKAKIIYVYRNPRDVCVSLLNHYKVVFNYTGDLSTMVNLFTSDSIPYAPYFTHLLSFWNKRKDLSNLLIVSYEEMQMDLANVARKVAAFINVRLPEEDIPKLCDHLAVDTMRKNPLVNNEGFMNKRKSMMNSKCTGTFINKGKTGNWKEHLDDKMLEQLKEFEKNWLNDSDLKFIYEI